MHMRKRVIPFAYAQSIFEIEPVFYVRLGVKHLLVDLDNTLDPYTVDEPTERTKRWAQAVETAGLDITILSNNTGKRVSRYAKLLGVNFQGMMKKPFSGPLKRYLKDKGIAPSEAMLVGDQIQTDVKAANGAGVRVVLTEPLDPHEPPWTKFNRLFDKPKRKKMKKQGLLRNWEDIHE